MNTRILAAFGAAALLSLSAYAQTSGAADPATTGMTTLSDTTVTPGSWVQAALARHSAYIQSRVRGPQNGEIPTLPEESASTGSSSTDLLGLLGQLGSGDLSGLLGQLGSLTGTTTTDSSTTGTDTTGSTTTGSQYTLEDLLALQAANSGNTAKAKNSTAQTANRTTTGGISRLPKPEDRFQTGTGTGTTTTDTRSFRTRWLDKMLQTTFTAITVGFSTPQFVTFLENILRPLFNPTDSSSNGNDNAASNNNGSTDANTNDNSAVVDNSNANNNSGDNTNNNGGTGVEDIPPASNDNADGTV